jgi:hypothetical protein
MCRAGGDKVKGVEIRPCLERDEIGPAASERVLSGRWGLFAGWPAMRNGPVRLPVGTVRTGDFARRPERRPTGVYSKLPRSPRRKSRQNGNPGHAPAMALMELLHVVFSSTEIRRWI